MNRKGNQRTVRTDQKIRSVFLELLRNKEVSRISVSEICAKADIHRTTFYVHYQDIYDLMEHLVGEMYVEIMGYFTDEESVWKGKGFLGLFQLIWKHQEFFSAYLAASKDTKWEHQLMPDLLEKKAEQLCREIGFVSKEELFYHQTFFNAGLTAMIRRWILGGCRETPEEMNRILTDEYTLDRRHLLQ